jgi:hypothetical protein
MEKYFLSSTLAVTDANGKIVKVKTTLVREFVHISKAEHYFDKTSGIVDNVKNMVGHSSNSIGHIEHLISGEGFSCRKCGMEMSAQIPIEAIRCHCDDVWDISERLSHGVFAGALAKASSETHSQEILDNNTAQLLLTALEKYEPEPWEAILRNRLLEDLKIIILGRKEN